MTPGADLVEVMFAGDLVEAEMARGLLENGGIASILEPIGINGPQLGVGLLPHSPQRVMVRASEADAARRLLAEVGVAEDLGAAEPANAAYLEEGQGRGPRGYGLVGAYARIWLWSFAAFAVAFGVFLLARIA